MTGSVPDVLADPVGVVVSLITGVEPDLDRHAAEAAVRSVAGGRAKRRKLAQSLTRRPAVLADGRSPAPRVAGNLLIALRNAGASVISPPVCVTCDKQLRTLQRRGEDWYCSVCIRRAGTLLGLRPGPRSSPAVTGKDSPAARSAPIGMTGTRWPSWPPRSRRWIPRCQPT